MGVIPPGAGNYFKNTALELIKDYPLTSVDRELLVDDNIHILSFSILAKKLHKGFFFFGNFTNLHIFNVQ